MMIVILNLISIRKVYINNVLVGFGIKLELIIRRIFDVLKIYFRLENKF